ncbi:MAG: sulfotransferase [Gammaproteobacteria bacterium]|nr:sulfotransferase [Gammaproteobacteria bacterium]
MIKDFQPVFIIGAGRSGTKLLRDLLAASSEVAEVPYDVGYVWRYKNERVPHDELTVSDLSESIAHYVRKTLPNLVNKNADKNASVMIEKSVPNSLRVAFLAAIYPNAKFIHLIRDGRAVVESAARMWTLPPQKGYLKDKLKYFPLSNYRYAIWYLMNMVVGRFSSKRGQKVWGPRYKGMDIDSESQSLDVICARQWKHCVDKAQQQLSDVASDRVLTLTYESLVSDESAIESVCDFIGVNQVEDVIQRYRQQVTQENLEKWRDRLSSERLAVILPEIESTLRNCGYLEN